MPSASSLEKRKYEGRATIGGSAGAPVIRGHAIVFNEPSLVLGSWMTDGGFQEVILPRAMDRTLREKIDLRAFFDHDAGRVLGRLRPPDGFTPTLRVNVDRRGLYVEIDPDPEIVAHHDLIRQIQRGDITGMSFSFQTLADRWDQTADPPRREVQDMRVFEVSVVAMPAYEQTDVEVGMRSLMLARGQIKTVTELQAAHEARALSWRAKGGGAHAVR